jgi:predicted  nucleic acid-binding Zn-ribbon protein
MSSINGAGELGIYVRSLRDRAATVRRLARDITNEEAVRSLHKHADELERKASELESKISVL